MLKQILQCLANDSKIQSRERWQAVHYSDRNSSVHHHRQGLKVLIPRALWISNKRNFMSELKNDLPCNAQVNNCNSYNIFII